MPTAARFQKLTKKKIIMHLFPEQNFTDDEDAGLARLQLPMPVADAKTAAKLNNCLSARKTICGRRLEDLRAFSESRELAVDPVIFVDRAEA